MPLKDFEEDKIEDPVNIILSSPGGSIFDAMIICNIIDNYKKKLNIYVYGYALSMGAMILCSGNKNSNVKKYCYPFSIGLMHAGAESAFGESGSVRDTINFNTKYDALVRDYVLANTNFTEDDWEFLSRHQMYLTAQEMKEKGMIDEIIGAEAKAIEGTN